MKKIDEIFKLGIAPDYVIEDLRRMVDESLSIPPAAPTFIFWSGVGDPPEKLLEIGRRCHIPVNTFSGPYRRKETA
jgi:hypothetical protein